MSKFREQGCSSPGRIAGLLLAVLLLALCPVRSAAYFERFQAGARATSMGGAYAAVADDASATYWNPAALVTLPRGEVLFMYARPFVVSNLQAGYAALSLTRGGFSYGLSWHHTGVSETISENMISFAIARDLLPPGSRYAVAAGATLKLAHVGYPVSGEQDYGREFRVTGDLGLLVNPTRKLALSYVARNLNQPSFDFVDGGGGTCIRRTHDVGFAYRWHPASTLALTLNRDARGDWAMHAGTEVWFYDVFGLRTGFSSGEFSGGAGLRTNHYLIDVAFVTHAELGVSYEVSLRVPFGQRRW